MLPCPCNLCSQLCSFSQPKIPPAYLWSQFCLQHPSLCYSFKVMDHYFAFTWWPSIIELSWQAAKLFVWLNQSQGKGQIGWWWTCGTREARLTKTKFRKQDFVETNDYQTRLCGNKWLSMYNKSVSLQVLTERSTDVFPLKKMMSVSWMALSVVQFYRTNHCSQL